VVATWGGTSRGEISLASDLDVLWWSPGPVAAPRVVAKSAAYVDVIRCTGDRDRLRDWATSNGTDLAGVLFARRPRGPAVLVEEFVDVRQRLWDDSRRRALMFVHLVSVACRAPSSQPSLRRAKFDEGGTRGWAWLGDCCRLLTGSPGTSTLRKLQNAVDDGLVGRDVLDAWRRAWRRRVAEERGEPGDGIPAADVAIWRAAVGSLLETAAPWLAESLDVPRPALAAIAESVTSGRSGVIASAAPVSSAHRMLAWMWGEPPTDAELAAALGAPDAWWTANAVLANPESGSDLILALLDHVSQHGEWWRDRNLILYSLRHSSADARVADLVDGLAQHLRDLDLRELRHLRTRLERGRTPDEGHLPDLRRSPLGR